MAAIMSATIFALRLFYFSRLHIFGTFLLLILFEAILYYIYYVFKFGEDVDKDIESLDERRAFLNQQINIVRIQADSLI